MQLLTDLFNQYHSNKEPRPMRIDTIPNELETSDPAYILEQMEEYELNQGNEQLLWY